MIHLKNLVKSYSVQGNIFKALDDISFSVTKREIFGVIGKSGAGKSTLLRCVNLLERPDSGEVIFDGQEMTGLSAKALRVKRQQMGMIFQQFNLLETRTVYENIAFPLHLKRYSKQKIKAAIAPLLELTGLQDKISTYPSQLSGGQKQRVAIARALITQPKVLLCDEATSALDPESTQTILKLLKDINVQLDLTILLITHEMDVVKQICDKIALIHEGHLVEQATLEDFFNAPKSDLAKKLINTSLRSELPESIRRRLQEEHHEGKNLLLRIYFRGHHTQEPIIARLIHETDIEINILQANIEVIKETTMGTMILEIAADQAKYQQIDSFLRQCDVHNEVIGYV